MACVRFTSAGLYRPSKQGCFGWSFFVIHGEAGMTREVAAYGLQMLHRLVKLVSSALKVVKFLLQTTLFGLLDHPFNL